MDSTVTCYGCGKSILREHSHPFHRTPLLTPPNGFRLRAFQYVYGKNEYYCHDCYNSRYRRLTLFLIGVSAIIIILILGISVQLFVR